MQLYLKSFKADEGQDTNRQDYGTFLMKEDQAESKKLFLEYINKLQPSFERFKKTVAFKCLYHKVKEFEQISERVYK